jgi:hypothetical protein
MYNFGLLPKPIQLELEASVLVKSKCHKESSLMISKQQKVRVRTSHFL